MPTYMQLPMLRMFERASPIDSLSAGFYQVERFRPDSTVAESRLRLSLEGEMNDLCNRNFVNTSARHCTMSEYT